MRVVLALAAAWSLVAVVQRRRRRRRLASLSFVTRDEAWDVVAKDSPASATFEQMNRLRRNA